VCPGDAQNNTLKPWQHQQWVIPPQAKAEFVWAMEDVLAVYTRPDDPPCPQVCVEETSQQLGAETRRPIPAAPGQPQRNDYEYERKGTAHLFMVFEPLAGRRRVKVPERRTAVDCAQVLREGIDAQ
jgi:DDE superfamily endonuclease